MLESTVLSPLQRRKCTDVVFLVTVSSGESQFVMNNEINIVTILNGKQSGTERSLKM